MPAWGAWRIAARRRPCQPPGPRPARGPLGGGRASAGRERSSARRRRAAPDARQTARMTMPARGRVTIAARRHCRRRRRRPCERGPRAAIRAMSRSLAGVTRGRLYVPGRDRCSPASRVQCVTRNRRPFAASLLATANPCTCCFICRSSRRPLRTRTSGSLQDIAERMSKSRL